MRYVTPVILEFDADPQGGDRSLSMVGAAMVGRVPHVGFGWLTGRRPTNAIEELAAFVDATTPRAWPDGLLACVGHAVRALVERRRPAVFEWFDVQRAWTRPHNPKRLSDHFDIRPVRFEEDAYENPRWEPRVPFMALPAAFRPVLLRDVMRPIQLSGRL